ncbi:hypothetical protein [Belliella aquatica]|uniref:Uncharacterized protein n=1 Tax=Belliella aquatica TaxID=1323734 RepID=A0ABQ1M034_9BACT|nr:hypothetical protein [Belliella aquatica]MCH7407280.1 hypothetical protein [Belliella aquatica]GGC31431.1 hypothetical protein GCM10010993_07970 [Belliella aquatica]
MNCWVNMSVMPMALESGDFTFIPAVNCWVNMLDMPSFGRQAYGIGGKSEDLEGQFETAMW